MMQAKCLGRIHWMYSKRLIRAKMSKSAADISSIVGSLFAPLEGAMKSCLGLLLSKIYERNANEVFDELKQKERVPIHTTMSNIVLGDLCKLYKNLVLEKELIRNCAAVKARFRNNDGSSRRLFETGTCMSPSTLTKKNGMTSIRSYKIRSNPYASFGISEHYPNQIRLDSPACKLRRQTLSFRGTSGAASLPFTRVLAS